MGNDNKNQFSKVNPTLSVIVPCYNEEEVIQETHRRITEVLECLGCTFEIIYVNDGSQDNTMNYLRELNFIDHRVCILSFSRNFGHQIAVTAGIDNSRGEAVVIIDADLQDPPEIIEQMLAKWKEGYQIVYGKRQSREGENFFKLTTAKWFYRILNMLSEIPIPVDTGDFRLIDRKVVESLKNMPERDRFVRGMVSWVGFRQYALPYEREPRFAGTTKYPLKKMISFALDGIISFSIKPLNIATIIGFMASGLAFLGIVYALIMRMFTNIWVSGWTLMFIALLFMAGVQLLCIGIVGVYIGRIYKEAKKRPLYILNETYGFNCVKDKKIRKFQRLSSKT